MKLMAGLLTDAGTGQTSMSKLTHLLAFLVVTGIMIYLAHTHALTDSIMFAYMGTYSAYAVSSKIVSTVMAKAGIPATKDGGA